MTTGSTPSFRNASRSRCTCTACSRQKIQPKWRTKMKSVGLLLRDVRERRVLALEILHDKIGHDLRTSRLEDSIDHRPRAFDGAALHVEGEAAFPPKLLAVAGAAGAAVNELRQDRARAGREFRDLRAAQEELVRGRARGPGSLRRRTERPPSRSTRPGRQRRARRAPPPAPPIRRRERWWPRDQRPRESGRLEPRPRVPPRAGSGRRRSPCRRATPSGLRPGRECTSRPSRARSESPSRTAVF